MKIFYSVKSMCCAALLVLTFTVSAKSVELGFHIGKIMAAEITAQPQEVINLESYPYACKFSKTLYAVVTLKMVTNRSLSPLDYTLTVGNATGNCVSVVNNMESFICSPSVMYPSNKDYARMLFLIDGSKVRLPAPGKPVKAVLRTRLKGRGNVSFNMINLGSKPLSDCKNIPAAGALK